MNNINNELAYFYKVIKNMDYKELQRKKEISKHEVLDDTLFLNISEASDFEKVLTESTLLGWIELVEDKRLHRAIKSLSAEDQIFISYIVKACKTQRELAQLYGISQPAINLKFNNIIEKIRRKL